MTSTIVILRPRPAADATAVRAAGLGLRPVIAPLFAVRAQPWLAPSGSFDTIMFTSANAPRLAGPGLDRFLGLPCYAVGEATAGAARAAGFAKVRIGPADGPALLDLMAADRVSSALHLCGRERMPLAHPAVSIISVPVYAADPVEVLPDEAREALVAPAVVLIHSPRAGALFRQLVQPARRERVSIAAISAPAAAAAGDGWRRVEVAAQPRDEALLELAVKLCQTAGDD